MSVVVDFYRNIYFPFNIIFFLLEDRKHFKTVSLYELRFDQTIEDKIRIVFRISKICI